MDQLPPEIITLILEQFDTFSPDWAALMRLNRRINKIAHDLFATQYISVRDIARHGEAAVEHFRALLTRNNLIAEQGTPCYDGIIEFGGCALDLSPRHFRALMQHMSAGTAMFEDLMIMRPDLILIAWEAPLPRDNPLVAEAGCGNCRTCTNPEHASAHEIAVMAAANINKWLQETGVGNHYFDFDNAVAAMEPYYSAENYVAALRQIDPGYVRCHLINCISNDREGQFAGILFVAAVVDATRHDTAEAEAATELTDDELAGLQFPDDTPRPAILSDEVLSVLINWAAICDRDRMVMTINEYVRLDESGELFAIMFDPRQHKPRSVFPRYSRDWIESDSVAAVMLDGNNVDKARALSHVNAAPSEDISDNVGGLITYIVNRPMAD